MTLLSPHSQAHRFSVTRRTYESTIPRVSVRKGEIHSNLSVSTLKSWIQVRLDDPAQLKRLNLLAYGVSGNSRLIAFEEGFSPVLIGHSIEQGVEIIAMAGDAKVDEFVE